MTRKYIWICHSSASIIFTRKSKSYSLSSILCIEVGGAFLACRNLKFINIPMTILSIHIEAFDKCEALGLVSSNILHQFNQTNVAWHNYTLSVPSHTPLLQSSHKSTVSILAATTVNAKSMTPWHLYLGTKVWFHKEFEAIVDENSISTTLILILMTLFLVSLIKMTTFIFNLVTLCFTSLITTMTFKIVTSPQLYWTRMQLWHSHLDWNRIAVLWWFIWTHSCPTWSFIRALDYTRLQQWQHRMKEHCAMFLNWHWRWMYTTWRRKNNVILTLGKERRKSRKVWRRRVVR